MNNREEVKEKVISIIKEASPKFKDIEITEDTSLNANKEIDSMTFIYLICEFEQIFNIEIPEKRWNKLITLKDIIDEIENRRA